MGLIASLQAFAARAAAESKALRTLINGNAASLSALTTTDKSNLVAAINEIKAASPSTLNDLTDVNTAGVASGKVLKYDGTKWVPADDAIGPTTLSGLSDVDATGVANGEVLTFDSASGKWVPATPATGGADTLDGLTDVNTAGATSGQVLKYDGTNWVPSTDISGGGGGSLPGGGEAGQALVKASAADGDVKWADLSAAMGGGLVLIAEASPSDTGVVTFSNIPQRFATLRVDWVARSTASGADTSMKVSCNGDVVDTNYRSRFLNFYASTSNSNEETRIASWVSASGSPAGACGSGTLEVHQYAATGFFKQLRSDSFYRMTAPNNEVRQFISMEWRTTSPITSLSFALTSGNYVPGSSFRLYGIV